MQLSDIVDKSVAARADLVHKAADSVAVPGSIDPDLKQAYQRSKALNSFLEEFIQWQIDEDRNSEDGSVLSQGRQRRAIQDVLDEFLNKTTKWINDSFSKIQYGPKGAKNVYELSEAKIFASANKISRYLSTTMGTLWEDLAAISPYAVSPESDFGLSVTGIDAIVLSDGLRYAQLKTQRNTLTGSQKPRSVAELRIHKKPLFVACLDTHCGWTFSPTPGITRLAGKEFWDIIGMDYALIVSLVSQMVCKIEDNYSKKTSTN